MIFAVSVIMIVCASLLLILCLAGLGYMVHNGEWSSSNLGDKLGYGLFALFLVICLIVAIPTCYSSSQSYNRIEYYITSFNDAAPFTVGMHDDYFYMIESGTGLPVKEKVKESVIIRDEDTNPYVNAIRKFGEMDTKYYIHVPTDTFIYIV